MKSRLAKNIDRDGLERLKSPTLEDILAFVNGGKYEKFFLSKMKVDADGYRETMTKKGGRVYGDLVSILYACDRLAGDDATHSVEDIVEDLDDIALGYY